MTYVSPQFTLATSGAAEPPAGTAEGDLRDYPHIGGDEKCRHAKLLGAASEALSDSVLLRHGIMTFAGPEASPIDRILLAQHRLLRLQIKHTTGQTGGRYRFTMRKGYRNTGSGLRPYDLADFDLAALVVLPKNAVFFTAVLRESYALTRETVEAARLRPLESFEQAIADLDRWQARGGRA